MPDFGSIKWEVVDSLRRLKQSINCLTIESADKDQDYESVATKKQTNPNPKALRDPKIRYIFARRMAHQSEMKNVHGDFWFVGHKQCIEDNGLKVGFWNPRRRKVPWTPCALACMRERTVPLDSCFTSFHLKLIAASIGDCHLVMGEHSDSTTPAAFLGWGCRGRLVEARPRPCFVSHCWTEGHFGRCFDLTI